MKVGDKVKVIGSESIPAQFIGWTGEVTAIYDHKVMVQLIPRVGHVGSLSHTAYPSDLEIVNE